MYTGEFDYLTLSIYLFMGCLSMLLIKRIIKSSQVAVIKKTDNLWFFCGIFLLLYTIFATIRKVDYLIGGMDAIRYRDSFLSADQSIFTFSYDSEFLFTLFERVIRELTSNYRVFFAICYLIISLSYIVFISTYCKSDTVSCIPFVLTIFPFLKSFCTLRSSLAVAVFLLGLSVFKRKKTWGIIIISLTFFIHRLSILYIAFIFLYLIFDKYLRKLSGFKFGAVVCVLIVGAYTAAIFLRDYVIATGFLEGTDLWYIKQSVGVSIFQRWPMYITHVFLAIAMLVSNKKMSTSQEMTFVKLLCTFDIVAMPVSVILGFWRANEYLYIARLLMWGHLIQVNTRYLEYKNKFLLKLCVLALFVVWLVFRIYSEWDDLKIMPYIIG